MSFHYLRSRIKRCIKPEHPHLRKLKHPKRTTFQGSGCWLCTGPVDAHPGTNRKPRMRRAYGETQRSAWEMYMMLYQTNRKSKTEC